MKKFIIGLVIGPPPPPVVGFLYFAGGFAPVATSDPMMPFEKQMAGMALHSRMDKEMPKEVPIQTNEGTYADGAMVYNRNCAACHGTLGQPETAIAKGMFPHPPQLLPPRKGVTDDPAGETFWKVKNGIRLTGMPGFKDSLSEAEMWDVSLMLANADKLPDTVKQILAPAPASAPEAPATAAPAKP
jgi:thiosulfate dehydrogenase